MLSNLTQGSLRFTLGYVPPPPLGAKRLRYPVVTTQEFLSVQVDQRPVLMFSYILKRIVKGRAGILPAICRGRDARAPLPAPFLPGFLRVFWLEAP